MRDRDEQAHARRRDDPLRLDEWRTVLDQAEKRRSFLSYVRPAGTLPSRTSILMGSAKHGEAPPRLWLCEKGSSAAFEPRNADAERRAEPGVAAGRVPASRKE